MKTESQETMVSGRHFHLTILILHQADMDILKERCLGLSLRVVGTSPTLGEVFDGSDGNESACNAGDQGLIPGLGRSPGEGNGNRLHNSCQENSKDRGAWWATTMGSQRVQHD